ncbi:hypothetical protein [Halorhabdus salina]|uniref:hypothetical protein n=1 Tax=Halorhabdus salina TaxID=2750670 RepID=UPI0015EF6921|nr:hypothetical protein [Halorhabdus salina]
MTEEFADRSMAEHQRVFEKIWSQNPERQNWSSSSWWFFLLFPEGEAGYGPRQLMFSVAACVGEQCRVNDLPAPGMDVDRPVSDGVDRFNASTVGWAGDDEQVHDHVVTQPAEAVLSQDEQRLEAWADREDGTRRGSEVAALSDRPIGLEATVIGEDVEAEFEAWADLDSKMTAPQQSVNIDTSLGGIEVVALRQMDFEGTFALPDGEETLSGSCYFQRVCFDVPLFPWKWIWAIFPDGTSFSVMVPFVGPQLLRRGYKFFASNSLERLTIPLRQSGFWHWGDGSGHVEFDRVTVEPLLDTGEHPDFDVRVENDDGDYVRFVARTYGHARNWLERERLGGRASSHWSYNEYMFRMAGLAGRVEGTNLADANLGTGFGTLEYSTGLGL